MPTFEDPLMIVTDLDGSLLDHHTYSFDAARPWLERLLPAKIPIIICSSKTSAEILPLQQSLGIQGTPFIAENGAVLNCNKQAEDPGTPVKLYGHICHTLHNLRRLHGFKFIGFSDVTEREVAEWTGLTPQDAAMARMREGSESIIWRDTDEKFTAFQQALGEAQLMLVQGGRFWHVMEHGRGKEKALKALLAQYLHPEGKRFSTIGLGDGPNDAPMLDEVDFAVVIKGYSKKPVELMREDRQNIYYSAEYGPQGWSEGLAHFIHS
ncbi:mannosyl-3-phosphoglycerate phosphatase-related protein [Erwinia psidii]|uniref:Mannosyl-3-phosphoglycerate phosphatase-related protein n=1 Tax=Erwinia psidii TaxID=69224 RepID=A0A3N6S184_9GAMM|nr:mannosyl-3-phosphoglycerate phosphatase-related protein [Erwinia psidii]MCX8956328.1 mannosyl-3-phosphoglycerate phosphatase-related protein [Erwinia psidii]MCX8963458.1 mannosyl-3-phosphoglycerate phosphatase-related protein [Erwinia psidii]RQM39328.1 mannosyl-3-phosphoglycerate phosphatase-related protein [Erwinia psidii]